MIDTTELNFNSDEVEPIGSFEPLPVGDYLVVISASEKKPTKTGMGEYLQLTYDVIDGEYKGRKLFDRLNIRNENETAQAIAQASLSAICHVTGVPRPKDSEELHDKPFIVRVAIRPAKDEFAASNIVKEYKYSDGRKLKEAVSKANPKTVPHGENTAASAAPGSKPWQKKK